MAVAVHQFVVRDSEGLSISMETFRGKVLLVVNVASRLGKSSSAKSSLILDKFQKWPVLLVYLIFAKFLPN